MMQGLISGGAPAFSGAMVDLTSAESLSAGVYATLDWDAETYDLGGWWESGSPSRLTVPAGVSYCQVQANLLFGSGGPVRIAGIIRKNGANFDGHAFMDVRADGASANPSLGLLTGVVAVSEGDYFECLALAANANTIAAGTSSWFSIRKII